MRDSADSRTNCRACITSVWVAILVMCASALSGCNALTYADSRPVVESGFNIAITRDTLDIATGDTARAIIRSTRTGRFAGTITYSIRSAPDGLTLLLDQTASPDSAALTVIASAALLPGTYSMLVRAEAVGAPSREVPLLVTIRPSSPASSTFASIATGLHSCALSDEHLAYCWGDNTSGELGHGDTVPDTPLPVAISGGVRFQMVSLAKHAGFSCGLRLDGAAFCWGANDHFQLGDGTSTTRPTPSRIASDLSFRSIAVGSAHACAISTTGAAYCWGFTTHGAFGNAMLGTQPVPIRAAVGLDLASVVAGGDFTCALTTTGAAYCWGFGVTGQLGDGRATSSTTPVAVAGDQRFRTLTASEQGACGVTFAGAAYCWGFNVFGTTGDGTSGLGGGPTRRVSPVAVAGGLTFLSLSAGFQTVCGVTVDLVGYCWGYNDTGAVGDGTTDHRAQPTRVLGDLRVEQIAAGTVSSCALTTAHAVYCWGENYHGALGIGRDDDAIILTPTAVRRPGNP
jgi:alpha-tubulin suppressor-like RCC1 family protein